MNAPAWHAGEQELHRGQGIAARMAEVGTRVLRDHMPEQHRAFFAELPVVYAGLVDGSGQPWASLLAGAPGFVSSPTPQALRIEARAQQGDPVGASWREGAPVALLGLQAETGRRNRMNGRIVADRDGAFEVAVGQSFGNCPKYIHPRRAVHVPSEAPGEVTTGDRLDEAALRIVRGADTFFIASAHPEAARSRNSAEGVDVSHRGGPAGFVRVQADGALLAPDYPGNMFFNTLGNLQLEPRCGLLLLDFRSGERLHLACRASLLTDAAHIGQWAGALRVLRFQVERMVRVAQGLPLRWQQG
ncbi:pyridoxamine 5'-phosphate oxidase family protein [Ramlibacter sp. AN1133]|uniref:pyridoxamine 5'-phosphate oxidase family protein n=1 Tax=Ramlibacter sp. AN1133 TaxID=3133429 RepID=UPI0030BC6277